MKSLQKFLWRLLSLAVLAGVGWGLWIGWQGMAAEEEEAGLGEIPTARAEVRDITVSVSATGVLRHRHHEHHAGVGDRAHPAPEAS